MSNNIVKSVKLKRVKSDGERDLGGSSLKWGTGSRNGRTGFFHGSPVIWEGIGQYQKSG